MKPLRLAWISLAAAVLAAIPRLAAAQASPQDQAAAQSLYDQARKLTAAKEWAGACPKLEESQRLDPTPVTEFYLADCYEHTGRTASAWTTFLDLAANEHKNGGPKAAERERVARDRAKALEPKLSQLVIDVPATVRAPGLTIKRDGEIVREGQWGAPVAVDPGAHTIEASAPGKKTWTSTQAVQGPGSSTVHVESLADAPVEAAPPPSATPAPPPSSVAVPAAAESHASPLKTVGIVVGAAGVVGLVVGGIFGADALSKKSSADNGHCGGPLGGANACDSTGVTLRSQAVSAGTVSTVAFIAGGVLAAGGVTLFLVAPSSSVQAGPAVGADGAGVLVRGRF